MAMALEPTSAPPNTPTPLDQPASDYFRDLGIQTAFEIFYRVSKGETSYKVAKDLGKDPGTVTRLLNGDHRAGRRQRPAFSELLQQDAEFKAQYETYAKQKDTAFESKRWDRKDFNSIPMIREWKAAKIRSNSRSQVNNIAILKRVLTGEIVPSYRCSPDRFTLDLDVKKPSEVRRFVDLYLQQHPEEKKLPQWLSIAIRDFLCVCHNITIPRNRGQDYGLSGAKDCYGQHNSVMLANSQWLTALEIFLKEGDLKLACKTAVGCEGFPRTETLNNLNPASFTLKTRELDGQLCQYYIFQKFEKKTEKHKLTPFTSEIFHPVAIEITKAYLETFRPRQTMFVDGLNSHQVTKMNKQHNDKLRAIYEQFNITDSYFNQMPTYVFRHTGAQRMARRCNGNLAIVSLRGWLGEDTLKDCYAGLEGNDPFEENTCYECKPPKYPNVDGERFCSLKCTVLYYTKHYDEIIAPFTPLIQAAKEATR